MRTGEFMEGELLHAEGFGIVYVEAELAEPADALRVAHVHIVHQVSVAPKHLLDPSTTLDEEIACELLGARRREHPGNSATFGVLHDPSHKYELARVQSDATIRNVAETHRST